MVTQPGAIAVHVRRGDYANSEALAFHGVAASKYYEAAVKVLRRMGFDGPLVMFSDDRNAAATELQSLGEINIPAAHEHLGDLDQMLLMSEAPALVMANSSYSWWSAWIGETTKRPVICPRPWFNDDSMDERDLLMPTWLTLER